MYIYATYGQCNVYLEPLIRGRFIKIEEEDFKNDWIIGWVYWITDVIISSVIDVIILCIKLWTKSLVENEEYIYINCCMKYIIKLILFVMTFSFDAVFVSYYKVGYLTFEGESLTVVYTDS